MKLEFVRPFLTQISEGCPQDKYERESRPVLGCIYVQITKDGVIEAVSTDSYILVHRSAQLTPKPLTMDWTLFDAYRIKQAMKWFGKRDEADIRFAKEGITISSAFVSVTVPPFEGEFPNWLRLFPKGDLKAVETIAFNPSLAAKIQKAFGGTSVICHFYNDVLPILVRPSEEILGLAGDRQDQWAILMPIKRPR